MIICDNHPVEYGHQCGTTLNNNTSITSAHGVEYKGSTVDQSKFILCIELYYTKTVSLVKSLK